MGIARLGGIPMATPVVKLITRNNSRVLACFDLVPGDYSIGRDPACSITLESSDVSRKHALLTVTEESCTLEDIGGRFGTLVADRQIVGKVRLQLGQTFTLGRTTVELASVEPKSEDAPTSQPSHSERYEISRKLAKGGMGEVYLALDRQLQRHVALKVMTPEVAANKDLANRFTQEALVLGRLDHPHIVPIHDLGNDTKGRNYYAMKFVRGTTLKDVLHALRQGQASVVERYPLSRLLDVYSKVCDAVAYAHSKGIIHRDLKPANIMIGEFGEVMVMDWGISKILNQPESRILPVEPFTPKEGTQYGTIMGTPSFMAPEQAAGQLEIINERTDIYSLGAILYNILTLRPPITGSSTNAKVMERIKSGQISPPIAFTNDSNDATVLLHCPDHQVPEALSAVAMQALSKAQSDRYPDIHSLQRDVAAFTAGYAPKAEKAGLFRQMRLTVRRHAILAAASGVIILLTLIFASHAYWSERQQSKVIAQYAAAAPKCHELAGQLMNRGLFREALSPAELSTQLVPEKAKYWRRLARVQLALHQPTVAHRSIRRAEKLGGSDKFTVQAGKICQQLSDEYGSDTLPLHALGVVFHWQNRRGMSMDARYTLARIEIEKSNTWKAAQTAIKKIGLSGRIQRNQYGYLKINLASTKTRDLSLFSRLPVYSLNLWKTQVSNLEALKQMPLRQLSLAYTSVSDLTPLKGRPLQSLTIAYSPIEDLTPLKGAPLIHLHLSSTKTDNLSPLKNMPLKTLHLDRTLITNLKPLAGLPIHELRLDGCEKLQDLTPLAQCTELEVLILPRNHGNIDFLRNLPKLKKLSYRFENDPAKLESASQFWRTRNIASKR